MTGALRRTVVRGGIDSALSTAVALVALLIALGFIAAAGVPPAEAAAAFFEGAFGNPIFFAGTIAKMVPLVLVALGWIIVYRASRFHVGFPGQILIGGLLAAIVALEVDAPAAVHLPLAVAAGMLGGALFAGIVAWLWASRGVNEILSTLLLNLVAIEIISWVVRGPLQEPGGALPQTAGLPASARWPVVGDTYTLHWDVLLIPAAVVAVAFALARTSFGFRVRLVGANERAARHTGTSPARVGVQAIVLSGALAGLAGGSLLLAGETPGMTDNFGSNYGFPGIAVALLARNSPLGVIPAALLFASLRQGGGVMEGTVGVSSAVVDVTQGIVIVLVLAATSVLYVLKKGPAWARGAAPEPVRKTA